VNANQVEPRFLIKVISRTIISRSGWSIRFTGKLVVRECRGCNWFPVQKELAFLYGEITHSKIGLAAINLARLHHHLEIQVVKVRLLAAPGRVSGYSGSGN